ncbi:thioesterase superfamily [Ruegeria sp. TM1040]|jgi:YbgC/YbaW family acyl-CoA thioester hydrolase|uniref:acyl-CoA thioesterase n=1 Tax=Ruegeria sp. (strain TM1040) TaxID=292414 RepID=UPI0000463117|nr:thioesterase family protein [Ruegeria sp. TM1040]ABF64581.1 thioesterase superfamily [Ruegeria sp. TM1040]
MPAFLSFRSVVDPADCDFLGHMNVSRYFAACSDGVFAIQSEMGLTASDMREGRRLSFAVVNVQSNFRAELAAGDAIRLETSIIDVGTKSMTFRHRMFRADENLLAFETVFKCVMFDLEARISRDIPDEVRARASQFLEEA